MSQLDIFGDPEPVASSAPPAHDETMGIRAHHAELIGLLPEKFRPSSTPALSVPTGKAELDAWTRSTQRIYLLYLIGAIARGVYRDSSEANAPFVLMKLNGLGGEW
ncbi:hypothetical protein [Paraburkholderia phenoliruptrix]|uniref:hypothetical protein n=1 Tax=Paraburkholderia phenoliruptrix TaxID=252970 RepID=UPI001C6E6EAC|nr:hypothetical protein [Paraburkholderia phenoliruptrix]MBW9102932.1 hypothetical protein [Paraburkholderia phenoliruptrix]MBW9132906.1 hypothetical protein [Paraburkholderia ginsengiterrae]